MISQWLSFSVRFPFKMLLAKYVPEHEDKAQSNHNPEDDRVPPLPEVDLVHQVVDHWELVRQIVQLGLDSLKEAGLNYHQLSDHQIFPFSKLCVNFKVISDIVQWREE